MNDKPADIDFPAEGKADLRVPTPSPKRVYTLRWRLMLFLSCCAIGAAIGVIGKILTGRDFGYLAVPLLIALAWIFVADPTECGVPSSTRATSIRPGASGTTGAHTRERAAKPCQQLADRTDPTSTRAPRAVRSERWRNAEGDGAEDASVTNSGGESGIRTRGGL